MTGPAQEPPAEALTPSCIFQDDLGYAKQRMEEVSGCLCVLRTLTAPQAPFIKRLTNIIIHIVTRAVSFNVLIPIN